MWVEREREGEMVLSRGGITGNPHVGSMKCTEANHGIHGEESCGQASQTSRTRGGNFNFG